MSIVSKVSLELLLLLIKGFPEVKSSIQPELVFLISKCSVTLSAGLDHWDELSAIWPCDWDHTFM